MTDRESLWQRGTRKLLDVGPDKRINLVLAYCRTCERQTIHERRGFVFHCEKCIEEESG